jgi:serine/arginine repetitive matrix protein 2
MRCHRVELKIHTTGHHPPASVAVPITPHVQPSSSSAMHNNSGLRAPTRRSHSTNTLPNPEISTTNVGRRSSKQNPRLSAPLLGTLQPLHLDVSPVVISSSQSSTGPSDYSSDDEQKDRSAALINNADPQRRVWHDILPSGAPDSDYDSSAGLPNDGDAEAIVWKYAGLKKEDFLAIQEKLVGAAIARRDTTPHHVRSLRRRSTPHHTPASRRRQPNY